ncbi:MAG: HU family DNA-binding protein [Thermodesulfobacterium sp.]|nr:HU family DNA-binding protein [Thermodesulfobacterium sp.]
MNKTEFVRAVAEKAGIIKKEAAAVVNAVLEVIEETVKKGEEIRIPGFGTFKVVTRKERKGRNPRTGKEIMIPAAKIVKFAPGAKLKNL